MRLSIAAISLLACFGVLLLASSEPLGAWILGFAALLGIPVVLQALRPGWHYSVGSEGIEVRRSLSTRTMRREDIASVESIDGTRVEELLAGPQRAGVNAGRTMHVAQGLRARKELGRIIAFASAPVVLTQTRSGGSRVPRAIGAKAPGRFVLVTMESGELRALSPRDVEGFVQAWGASAP